MADYQQRVAERIKATRERQGLSPEDFAYKAGVSAKQLRRIEAGKSEPRLSTVRKLADAGGVELDYLRPDLEAEDRAVAQQLDRIEEKLDEILKRTAPREEPDRVPPPEEELGDEPLPQTPPPDAEDMGEAETG